MVRFPPSDQPGVYGVYTPVGGVSRPCALSTTDPLREEYQNGVGRSPAPAPAKTTKKPAAKAREVRPPAEVTRVHNLRYSGADMSLVLARWNPETLEPNPYMLRMSPVWQDPHDFRPWLELVEELEQLLALRRGSYGRDPARPLAEIQRHREMVDAALEALQGAGRVDKRKLPMAVSTTSVSAEAAPKRARKGGQGSLGVCLSVRRREWWPPL